MTPKQKGAIHLIAGDRPLSESDILREAFFLYLQYPRPEEELVAFRLGNALLDHQLRRVFGWIGPAGVMR